MSARKALIIDNDPNVRNMISALFHLHQIEVLEAEHMPAAMECINEHRPDIVLMEINLPGIDGFAHFRELRESFVHPIILLTERREEFDRVLGLELGADDYVTKPFSPRELLARVKAIFRRMRCREEISLLPAEETYTFDGLTLYTERRELRVDDERIELRPKEFDLLLIMVRSPGTVYTREQLLNEVWGQDSCCELRTVDVYVKKLRQKLSRLDCDLIHTVWGVGYKFQVMNKEMVR